MSAIIIPKNGGRTQIRVERREYKGHEFLDAREWYQDRHSNEWKPGKGLAIPPHPVTAAQVAVAILLVAGVAVPAELAAYSAGHDLVSGLETLSDDIRIEYPSAGATYRRDEYGVYQYDDYPPGSVLAGQQRRRFLAAFPTLEAAQAAYPGAREEGCGYVPPSLGHLPEEGEEV